MAGCVLFKNVSSERKYLAEGGVTKLVKRDGRQYTLTHGMVFVDATATGMELLGFRRKVG